MRGERLGGFREIGGRRVAGGWAAQNFDGSTGACRLWGGGGDEGVRVRGFLVVWLRVLLVNGRFWRLKNWSAVCCEFTIYLCLQA